MSGLCIENARLFRAGAFESGGLRAEDGLITAVGRVRAERGDLVVDAGGGLLLPGFIDLHTHGAVGVDVNAADADGLRKLGSFFASHGVTGWLCSVLSDSEEQTLRVIGEAKKVMAEPYDGAQLLGIHMEGPFLSPAYAGAMPRSMLRQGDAEYFRRCQSAAGGAVRYITVAPEVPGVEQMVGEISGGTAVAMGHSAATYDQTMACIALGAKASTHTFNAMRLFHQHEPAIMGAALESDIYCEAICDGRHLHPASVRLLFKAKGGERVVAVTDSIMAAGLPDGQYMLGINPITVLNGDAKLTSDGTRAGSTLTMDLALKNLRRFTGRPLAELVPALTENPAALIGVGDRLGRLERGCDASLTLTDEQLNVSRVFVRGRQVFNKT